MFDILNIVDKHLKDPLDYSFRPAADCYHCYQRLTEFKKLPGRLKIRKTVDKNVTHLTDSVIEGFNDNMERVFISPLIPSDIENLYYGFESFYSGDKRSLIIFCFNSSKMMLYVFYFNNFLPPENAINKFLAEFDPHIIKY